MAPSGASTGFWTNWFKPSGGSGGATRKWTLEELRELYEVLTRNVVVTDANRALVVETIRSIAEYILWGDQNEPRIFDFFLENNVIQVLHRVLLQPANRSGEVAKQVLQTLAIIIQNVRSETGTFFIFSNNHVNNIVDLEYDFQDEEVLGFYVSLLKTIGLKLNAGTVHFFLNGSPTGRRFPLYCRALSLAHNREGMVRAAVRSLTLAVYSVPDPAIAAFVAAPPAAGYFGEVAAYLAEQVQLLDARLAAAEGGGSQALSSLDSQLAEVEDVLAYASDLLSLGVPSIAQLMADSLWQCLVRPLLLRPLQEPGAAASQQQQPPGGSAAALSRGASGVSSPHAAGHFRHFSWGSGSWQPDASRQQAVAAQRLRPVCAVFVLERLFLLVTYPPLLQQVLLALACGGDSSSSNSCRSCLLGMLSSGQAYPAVLVLRLLTAVLNNRHLPAELLAALSVLPRKQQQQASSSGGEEQAALQRLVQAAMQQLQPAASAPGGPDGGVQQQQNGPVAASSSRPGLLEVLTQRYLPREQQQPGLSDAAGGKFHHHRRSSSTGVGADCLQALEGSGAAAAASEASFSGFGQQLLACLVQLLALPGLPPLGLWLLGWLLHQLLPAAAAAGSGVGAVVAAGSQQPAAGSGSEIGGADRSSMYTSARHSRQDSSSSSSGGSSDAGGLDSDDEGLAAEARSGLPPLSTQRTPSVQSNLCFEPRASVLSAAQQQVLQDVLASAREGFAEQLGSMWCEAVFPMLALEWPAARDMLLRPVLRAGSHALLSGPGVWPLMQVLQQQQQQAGARAADELSSSAAAALACYLAVQRVVALTQIQELLRVGGVACSPPVPTVSEADLKQVDIQEGYQVDLAPGSALPCVVSFAPGQERRVYFAVAGLSRTQLAALQGQPAAGGDASGPTVNSLGPEASAAAAAANHASLLRSLPVAVLADPSPSRPQAGVVLSVAPLLGARPYADASVPKWLHVHVRPSVRGLLRIIKTASGKKGGLLAAMRQLADGHWVLAFSAADKAALAVALAQQHAARLQALYGDALAPLCAGTHHHQQPEQQQAEQQPEQQQQPDAPSQAEQQTPQLAQPPAQQQQQPEQQPGQDLAAGVEQLSTELAPLGSSQGT